MNDRYCIIGAGPSGLAQARAFRLFGVDFDVYERQKDVGGLWDIENPETSLYESAHFISSRTLSAFAGFPMPDSYPDYPRHDQVLAYLRAFAEKFDLKRSIQFGQSVEQVTLAEEGVRVRVAGVEHEYAGVICATGVNWTPNTPEYPGKFSGTLRHTHSYRRAEELSNKRVLIIGLGNSGADIACDSARAARETYVSVRRGYYFIPKHIFGKPADVFAHEGPKLPNWLEPYVFGWLQKLVVGDVSALGMPKPDHRILETHPLMNDQLLHHLRHGDVTLKPDVARFSGSSVQFTDGSSAEVDEVLTATGYRMELPYLDPSEIEWTGRRVSHFLTAFSRKHPGLFTLGFAELNGALYPHADRLAALIAAYAQARSKDPDAAERFRSLARGSTGDLRGGKRHVKSERHDFYCDDEALKKATLAAFRKMGWKAPKPEDYRRLLA